MPRAGPVRHRSADRPDRRSGRSPRTADRTVKGPNSRRSSRRSAGRFRVVTPTSLITAAALPGAACAIRGSSGRSRRWMNSRTAPSGPGKYTDSEFQCGGPSDRVCPSESSRSTRVVSRSTAAPNQRPGTVNARWCTPGPISPATSRSRLAPITSSARSAVIVGGTSRRSPYRFAAPAGSAEVNSTSVMIIRTPLFTGLRVISVHSPQPHSSCKIPVRHRQGWLLLGWGADHAFPSGRSPTSSVPAGGTGYPASIVRA